MIVFAILGFLCIPGWIIFCFCAFCGCKCFNCCKTIKCRVPFFIIVSITNVFFLVASILGLIKINTIFKGVSDSECSLLRLINEVLEGESKTVLPKWGGVSDIINIFEQTIDHIETISSDNTLSDTQAKKDAYETAKTIFINDLQNACTSISGESTYKYKTDNIFDIAYYFGSYESGTNFTAESYAEKWVKEAEITNEVKELYDILGLIIHSHVNEVILDAEVAIQEIGDGFEELKNNIGENILDYSEKINKYGKLIFRLIFIVLLIISILMETFFICLLIFSNRNNNHQNSACFMKFLINLFWNILALLVIVTILLGGIICVVGQVGKDLFEAFSFLVSSRNLLSPSPRIFENEGAYYLDICVNGEGEITEELGIENDLANIGDLKILTESLDIIINSITAKEENVDSDDVYDEIISEITKRKNNQIDYGFINGNTKNYLNLSEALSTLNEKLESCNIDDTWSLSCELSKQGACTSDVNTSKCMNPDTCNSELNTRYTSICPSTQESIETINKIFSTADNASDNSNTISIAYQASNVKSAYRTFLTSAKNALDEYTANFRRFSEIYNNFVGNGSILGFINCAFIGKNVKVLLNYLNDTIGKGFTTLGIVLVVEGIIMLCNISFTILLLAIFDEFARIRKIENDMKNKTDYNEGFPVQYQNRVIPSANVNINKY